MARADGQAWLGKWRREWKQEMHGAGPVLGPDTSCDRVLMVLGSQEMDLMAALCLLLLHLAAKVRSLWTYHRREGGDGIRPGADAAAALVRQNLAAALFGDKTAVLVTP